MNGEKRVILHLVFDGILFDKVYPSFEKMESYENRYLYCEIGGKHKFEYIKNTEKLMQAVSIDEWKKIISDPQVDIVYLHGLWRDYFKAIDYIRQDVVVMWWCYGMEIYENCFNWPPLLSLKIYKPKTRWFNLKSSKGIRSLLTELSYSFPKLYVMIVRTFNFIKRRKGNELRRILSRIDFASTPLEIELLELKKRHPYIKAKPYRLRGTVVKEPLVEHKDTGCVLLEHSANISNNHLDIIAAIKSKKLDLHERDVYIPLSYGVKKMAEKVKEKADFEGANVHCLMDPLPFDEYKKMMSGCTHAIFGMIRQSGLGNIYLCFRKGVKVFFFKDSILYKQFKDDGYYVFSIEDDLNDSSIREPLTPEQTMNNYNKFYARYSVSVGTYQQQFDEMLK